MSGLSKLPAYKTSDVADLRPFERNARTHSDAHVQQIARSIREYGWTNPVLVDDSGTIIAGHGRVLAAKSLGLESVPTLTISNLTPEQIRAYVIADNKLALNAGWDEQLLALELGELQAAGYDLSLTGFGESELDTLFAKVGITDGLTDPDEIPVDPPTVAQPGDIWILGKHRVVCGDSTNADDVARALGGVVPHIMVTDPPYGVEYDPSWRNDSRMAGGLGKAPQARAMGKVENDDRADWREAWSLFPGDVAYVWHGGKHAGPVQQSLEAADFPIRAQIVWVKSRAPISRGDYHWRHEPCYYAVRKGAAGHWTGDRKQNTVWEIATNKENDTGHGTQKPVECMKRPIENNSSPGQAIYDPFLGSGTTLIAAEMTGRACHGLEISPKYVDVIVERWQRFTGKTAEREDVA